MRRLTDDQIAEMVKGRRAASTARKTELGQRAAAKGLDVRVDDAVRSVAAELGMGWRAVLKAYRAKYPASERASWRSRLSALLTLGLAALAGMVVVPVGAGATVVPGEVKDITHEWLVRRDLHAAVVYWGRRADCPAYAVETGPTPALAETDLWGCTQRWNAEAWAYFSEALHQAPAATPSWPGDNPKRRRVEYLRWSCTLEIHEYGHSLGLPDEYTAPRGIMFHAGGLDAPQTPALCVRFFPDSH